MACNSDLDALEASDGEAQLVCGWGVNFALPKDKNKTPSFLATGEMSFGSKEGPIYAAVCVRAKILTDSPTKKAADSWLSSVGRQLLYTLAREKLHALVVVTLPPNTIPIPFDMRNMEDNSAAK